jgi:hypothetical protein
MLLVLYLQGIRARVAHSQHLFRSTGCRSRDEFRKNLKVLGRSS